MYFNDDDKRMAILGEAAVVLARRDKQISVDSLLHQLKLMADYGGDIERLAAIDNTRDWLVKFRGISSRKRNDSAWFAETRGDGDSIYLAPPVNDEKVDES